MPDAEDYIDIIVSEPPGPESEFIEVVNSSGRSFRAGEWFELADGTWTLRIRFRGSIVQPTSDAGEVPADEQQGFV